LLSSPQPRQLTGIDQQEDAINTTTMKLSSPSTTQSTAVAAGPLIPLTRHTARFAKLARQLADACEYRGVDLEAAGVDEVLNNQVAHIATSMGLSSRTALRHLQQRTILPLADEVARLTAYLQTR
jgi:hypothetical protein